MSSLLCSHEGAKALSLLHETEIACLHDTQLVRVDLKGSLYMITGIGTDIVEISRIRRLRKKYGNNFLRKILSEKEITSIPKGDPDAFIAGRFAAREALVKALRNRDFNFPHVIIEKDSHGAPFFIIPEGVAEGLNLHLSISHERHYATATVIAEKPE